MYAYEIEAEAVATYRNAVDQLATTGGLETVGNLPLALAVVGVSWLDLKADGSLRQRMLARFAEGNAIEDEAAELQPQVDAAVKRATPLKNRRDAEQAKHNADPDYVSMRDVIGNARKNPKLEQLRKLAADAEQQVELAKDRQRGLWQRGDSLRAEANGLLPQFAAQVFSPLEPKTCAGHAAELAASRQTHASVIAKLVIAQAQATKARREQSERDAEDRAATAALLKMTNSPNQRNSLGRVHCH
jgi:hypothetical protein